MIIQETVNSKPFFEKTIIPQTLERKVVLVYFNILFTPKFSLT